MNALNIQVVEILKSFFSVGLPDKDNLKIFNRIETKFVIPAALVPDLLEKMKESYNIIETGKQRILTYRSVYLDTPDYLFFRQHVTGKLNRLKIRYREYIEPSETFLEIKQKTNKGRTNKYRIKSTISGKGTINESGTKFIKRFLQEDIETIIPVLTTTYRRASFLRKDNEERITLDMDISFSDCEGYTLEIPYAAIFELKTDRRNITGSPIAQIMKEFNINPSGFSKYCTGIALLKNIPGKNILKPQMLYLNRLKDENVRHLYA